MRMSKVLVTIALAAVLVSAVFFQTTHQANAQSSSIPISQEYASGDIQIGTCGCVQAWYSWVNINGTHTIFLALHSSSNPSPIFTFVGQAYNSSSGQKVFVGNGLLAMEVYNDTDGNGYLDANYATGTTELRYTILMNASQTFQGYPVNKTIVSGVPHYSWGAKYGTIQAYLIQATPPYYGYGGGQSASQISIDYVAVFYDFSVVGNTTFLKTSFRIGTISFVTNPVTLQGLSFSLLYATQTVASRPLTVTAGSSPYDSQTNQAASQFTAAQVNVDNVLAYEFRFKDNYTLSGGPSIYPAVYLASPIDSIPANAFQGNYFNPLIRVQDFVQGQLPDIAGLPSTSNINYSATKFLYRINYPTWGGLAIQHDPTYVAYLGAGGLSIPTSPPPGPPLIIYAAAATGILALLVAFNGFRRRRSVQPTDEAPNEGVAAL